MDQLLYRLLIVRPRFGSVRLIGPILRTVNQTLLRLVAGSVGVVLGLGLEQVHDDVIALLFKRSYSSDSQSESHSCLSSAGISTGRLDGFPVFHSVTRPQVETAPVLHKPGRRLLRVDCCSCGAV